MISEIQDLEVESARLGEALKDFATGGLRLRAWQVCLFGAGIVLATMADEIADFAT